MKNKKPIIVLFVTLIVISLACGLTGFLQSKKEVKQDPTKKYNVMYRYYLNDVEVEQMPTNSTLISSSMSTTDTSAEKLYAFNTATCTNKVTYKWDESSWTFTPDNTADSTCKLYFVTTYNPITIKATNAKVTPLTNNKIKRGEDAVIKITPTEGYEYDKTTCTNNEVVEWNKDKNELTVKSIYAETTCDVEYKISEFTVEIKVNNGTGATKVEYEYGKEVEVNVAASTGYGTPTITCTNNQTGQWSAGVYTIEKLTNETVCTIDFKLLQSSSSFSVELDTGEHGRLAAGTDTVNVLRGKSANFTLLIEAGWEIDTILCNGGNSSDIKKTGTTITIENVEENIECSLSYKQITE